MNFLGGSYGKNKKQNKNPESPKHRSTDEDTLKLRKSYSPKFFFQQGTWVGGAGGGGRVHLGTRTLMGQRDEWKKDLI